MMSLYLLCNATTYDVDSSDVQFVDSQGASDHMMHYKS